MPAILGAGQTAVIGDETGDPAERQELRRDQPSGGQDVLGLSLVAGETMASVPEVETGGATGVATGKLVEASSACCTRAARAVAPGVPKAESV
jgi:hypothetical protein